MGTEGHRESGRAIAFFLPTLGGGGAERAVVALANEVAGRGYVVDLVVGDAGGECRIEVSSAVTVVDFGRKSPVLDVCHLSAYLNRRNPIVVMSALDKANITLVCAAMLTSFKGRIVVSQRAVIDASLRELGVIRRLLTQFLMRLFFRRADAVVSNSMAAAVGVCERLNVPTGKVVTIHNALDVDRINRLAREPIWHPAFLKSQVPVIISVGSLTKRKDMGTLIRAFRIVLERREAELVIVGRGKEQHILESVISELRLSDRVHLVGFEANPYKWMAKAAVFVSSSTAEGFPNVVAEALALKRSVVATNCPGDTAELLGHGRWGRLVPVGDPERMAQAILAALDDPIPTDGRLRAVDFSPSRITLAYLTVLLPQLCRSGSKVRRSV